MLLVSTAQAADHDAFEYHVAFARDDKRHLVARLEAAGVRVHYLGASAGGWPTGLARLVKSLQPDVVHAHSPLPAVVARLVLRTIPRGRRPLMLSTEHNQWSSFAAPTRFANALTNRWDDRRMGSLVDVRDSMWAGQRQRVGVLVHGLGSTSADVAPSRAEVREQLGLEADAIMSITVANLRDQKDYPNLMQAAALATSREPRLRFFAVGQGPLENELRALHESMGLGERFTFLGYREDVTSLLSGADMFVLGSRHEGLPVALMEAMNASLPIVSTRVGGVPEAVTDGVEGVLVPTEDARALADAVVGLARDAALRQVMGARAKMRSGDFDIRGAVATMEQTYRTCAVRAARR